MDTPPNIYAPIKILPGFQVAKTTKARAIQPLPAVIFSCHIGAQQIDIYEPARAHIAPPKIIEQNTVPLFEDKPEPVVEQITKPVTTEMPKPIVELPEESDIDDDEKFSGINSLLNAQKEHISFFFSGIFY